MVYPANNLPDTGHGGFIMSDKTLDIIKGAILLEHRGRALYETAVKSTDIPEVKELFQMMMEEEAKHVQLLNKQYSLISKGKGFDSSGMENIQEETADSVLTKKVVKAISGSGFEAAVVSSALELEKRAVEYYSKCEKEANSDEEKKLFNWLVKWEKEHMMMLAQLDNEIKENVWYDNNFWPLD